jgi:hypothetical protein
MCADPVRRTPYTVLLFVFGVNPGIFLPIKEELSERFFGAGNNQVCAFQSLSISAGLKWGLHPLTFRKE